MDQSIKETSRPPYGILTVLMIGAFIAFLNNTLLNIALPSIMVDLNVEPSTVQWLATGFMLVNGVLVPMTAFLIQKYSVRHLFLVAMGLFTIGTIVAGAAHIFPILLTGRMLQAAGSAIMMPLLMNVMLVSFPVERRGSAMGMFGLIMMAAPAIGPTLSGWIVQNYDWRMLFHFLTPIAIIVVLIGYFLLKDKKQKVNLKLDIFSLVLSSIGFGGILYGFSAAGNAGWGSPQVYLTIIVGAIALLWFILRQSYQKKPMLNFGVYRYPMFALSSVITMVLNMAMFSGMLLLPIYVQTIRGIDPFEAGLMLLPGALAMAFMSPITGKLFDKFGGKVLAISGITILVVTTYYLSELTMETTYGFLMVLHAIRMFGISMVMMPVSTNGLNQLPRSFYPHGTAMNNTLNQVSGAIGTALLVTVMANRSVTHGNVMMEKAVGDLGSQPSGAALAALEQEVSMLATLEGINDAFFVATCISVVALVLAFFIKRAKPMEEPDTNPEGQKEEAKKVQAKLVEVK
ncbi:MULTISPECIES: DHA2 family efflux MFS transporter permease subunit [Sutcliffiella]|uniref:MFS transporter n=1 Tax=Sutcliffiella cohnii TaxID=33932 RepID=A0A223KL82_9BACI|nr:MULTISPECIES: DHA2 family efflux MFS transporter permease subunit [Sutcliffiella]AST90241.1 MFS transporter [Sutcliffiella cohnii]MED4015710.1 DHA2 family efflux MFS transporter permease subunit [Sutcliffiella cohnii]WBL15895.1 DHA2 family efflux MFS transporter permease subunit [Sutcliffiella sp. NC1]